VVFAVSHIEYGMLLIFFSPAVREITRSSFSGTIAGFSWARVAGAEPRAIARATTLETRDRVTVCSFADY
jgi:hypothetical protein